MLFDEDIQKRQLKRVLDKYKEIANANNSLLLYLIPKEEYWRFFIDGVRQQSTRGIRKGFVQALGEETVSSIEFQSLTINEYIHEYQNKRNILFTKKGKKKTIYQFLQYELYLDESQYFQLLALNLAGGRATIREVLLLDQAWLAFGINEPHYLMSVFKTFFTVAQSNEELTVEFIRKTHALLGEDVRGTNYDRDYLKPGDFRDTPYHAFGLARSNSSVDGITEMLDRKYKVHNFMVSVKDKSSKARFKMILNHQTIHELKKNHIIPEVIRYYSDGLFNNSSLDPDNNPLDDVLLELVSKIAGTKTNKALAELIYSLINRTYVFPKDTYICVINYAYSSPDIETQLFYESTLQLLIEDYYDNLKRAKSDLGRLRVIVTFIQRCEQLHPFGDMNCRLFCMIILNDLLSKNGFPYVIQPDPNRFDLYSIDELIDDMITGMKKTFELLEKNIVNGVDTEHLLKALESSPRYEFTFYAEFNKALKVIDAVTATPSITRAKQPNYNN